MPHGIRKNLGMSGVIREDDLAQGGSHQQDEQKIMNCLDHIKENMLQANYGRAAEKADECAKLLRKIKQEKR